MFDALMPRLQTITPPEGAGIYLKRLPDGETAFAIQRGVDFDNPDAIEPSDASVAVLLRVLQQMDVPGINAWGFPSVRDLSTEAGIGILIKRQQDGSFAIKVQTPITLDSSVMKRAGDATLSDLLDWIKAAFFRQG